MLSSTFPSAPTLLPCPELAKAMMEEERPPAEEGDAGRLMAEVDHLCVLTLLVGVKQLQHAAEYKSVVAETEVFCSKAEGKQAAPTGAPELREFDINALEAEVDGLLVATEVPADKETRTPLTTAVRAIKTVGDGVLSSRLNLTEAKVPASQPPEEVVKGVLCLSPTTQSRMELDLSRAVARKKAAESALRSRKILTLLRAEHMHSLREGFRPLVRIRAEAVAIETALQRPPGSSGVDGMTSAIWPGGDDLLPTCEPSRTGACSALLVAEERRGRPMIGVLIDAAESAEGQDEQVSQDELWEGTLSTNNDGVSLNDSRTGQDFVLSGIASLFLPHAQLSSLALHVAPAIFARRD